MPQPYDIRLPDLVGDFYRGKQMAFNAERAPIEAQQSDQLFAQKQQAIADDQETEMVGNIAGLIASAPAQHRPAMYAQMKGKIAGYAQRHGLPLSRTYPRPFRTAGSSERATIPAAGEKPNSAHDSASLRGPATRGAIAAG